MGRRQLVAWIGSAAVLATAVVALRHTQSPTAGPTAVPATTDPVKVSRVLRFTADGVLLPEPGEPPAPPRRVIAISTGPGRLRVAWGSALPDGVDPPNAIGYEVRWRPAGGGPQQRHLVAVPELQLDGLINDDGYVFEVRSVDAYGRRSAPALVTARPGNAPAIRAAEPWTGLFEDFSGPFSVDTVAVGGRWHFSGYQGCTRAAVATGQHAGQLAVDLDCGGDLTVLRYRTPMQLGSGPGERGRVAVVTDVAGPRGQLTIDLVPGPADQVGAGRDGAAPAVNPPNGTASVDPTLPDGAVRVLVGDDGARVVTGPGVPRTDDPPAPPRAPTRGVGVLHVFEVVLDTGGLRVLQDGMPVAVAGVAPSWTHAHVLIGFSGPPGRRSRVHLDAIALSGQPAPPPPSYAHPVVPATQRLLGPTEDAPGIGISGEPLRKAAMARLLVTVALIPGVDLDNVSVQYGDTALRARPILAVPSRTGSLVTVTTDLPPGLLGPASPPSVSPLVLRAPGAENTVVPIAGSYLEIVPLPAAQLSLPAPTATADKPAVQDALPSPTVRLLDSAENPTTTAPPGARLLVDVDLDRVGGQLESGAVAGVAGFELWLDNRRIAGMPTALDGPGIGGRYSVAVSTRRLGPGPHFLELRVIPADRAVRRLSRLASFTVAAP